jgi:hypothetical protein
MSDKPEVKRYYADCNTLSLFERDECDVDVVMASDFEASRAADKARIAELEGLLGDVQVDLLRRSERDSDGCKVVGIGNGIWSRIDAALAQNELSREA